MLKRRRSVEQLVTGHRPAGDGGLGLGARLHAAGLPDHAGYVAWIATYADPEFQRLAGWARESLALELPTQITCRDDCAGLCGQCGANLNEHPEHRHEAAPDPRWAKLGELKFD